MEERSNIPITFHHSIIILLDMSSFGHIEVVKLLMADRRVDPSDLNNYALKWAAQNKHTHVYDLLLTDRRVEIKYQRDLT